MALASEFFNCAKKPTRDYCQFLFVGRLAPYKCPDVVIKAFANSQTLRSQHKLIIAGDGPEMDALQKLVDENGLTDQIEFTGWQSQEQVSHLMANSDVFVFPTIREVGGNVILEAMSSGLPCIVPNYGGPSELIDKTVGIKVELTDKDQLINSYTEQMELLAGDSILREQLSKAARKKILQNYDWNVKGKIIHRLYQDLLASTATSPAASMAKR